MKNTYLESIEKREENVRPVYIVLTGLVLFVLAVVLQILFIYS